METPWVSKLFLIDDWEWFAMMIPMTLWYWLSMKWIDKNRGWHYDEAAQRIAK